MEYDGGPASKRVRPSPPSSKVTKDRSSSAATGTVEGVQVSDSLQGDRLSQPPGNPSQYIAPLDPPEIRRFLEMEEWWDAPASSSVVAPRVFAIGELLAHILSYLSPRDLLRIQRVNSTFYQAVTSRNIQQKLFLIPKQDTTRMVWNPLRGAAIPRWFCTACAPRRARETRIDTFYDHEDGKVAIERSRAGKGASWRRMLICQPALHSIRILYEDEIVKQRLNLEQVTISDVHAELESALRDEDCPIFGGFQIDYSEQTLELTINLVPVWTRRNHKGQCDEYLCAVWCD